MIDREVFVDPREDMGDGGAAVVVAGLFLIALVLVGAMFYFGIGSSGDHVIDISVPAAAVQTAVK